MAKINTKSKVTIHKTVKQKLNKVQSIKKGQNPFKIKDCFVKLNRLDVTSALSLLRDTANIEKTFNVDIKIHKNKITVKNQTLNFTKSKNANINLKIDRKDTLQTMCSVPTASQVNTLSQLINIAWRKCKTDNKGAELTIGQVVLSKMKGYSPWPGTVRGFTKNKKRVQILFFGTNNNGSDDVGETVSLELCHEVIRLLLLRPLPSFSKGIREAEVFLGIPDDQSITNQPEQLN